MSPRIVRIEFNCSLGTGKRLFIIASGIIGHECFGAEEEVIGPQRGRTQAHSPVTTDCLHSATDRRRNRAGDLILHGEDVPHVSIIPLRPKVVASTGLDELDSDPNPVVDPSHAAFDDIGDTELASDVLYLDRLVLEDKGRVAGDYEQRAEA